MLYAPSRSAAVLLTALLLFALAGCGTSERPDLLNDLAARLDRAGDLTFTAEYRLTDGAVAVLAQSKEPRRAAYTHPGGKLIATETQLADCWTGPTGMACTIKTPPSTTTDPVIDMLADAARNTPSSRPLAGRPTPAANSAAIVTPTMAVRLLSEAVLDGETITQHEATIADEPATCFGVHGSGGFTACITARGLLGSFAGTVDGRLMELELTRFSTSVDPVEFQLPDGATVVDLRSGQATGGGTETPAPPT